MINRCAVILSSILLAGVFSCSSVSSEGADTKASVPELSTDGRTTTGMRLEAALRQADRGGNLGDVKQTLESLVDDPAVTADQRDEAALGLSRVLESLGDAEEATRVIEALMLRNREVSAWRYSGQAETRLRELLAAKGSNAKYRGTYGDEEKPVSPFAKALASRMYKGGTLRLERIIFGGRRALVNNSGLFDVETAVTEGFNEDCPVCPHDVNTDAHSSQVSNWTSIPRFANKIPNAMVVFYYDSEDPIPARYDTYLPIPVAGIQEHLRTGKGLIVVKEREGTWPVILLAAPRKAQMKAVEEALAKMTEIPTEPVSVEVPYRLTSAEIQLGVRSTYDGLKACYEELIQRQPKAQCTLELSFTIKPDGRVSDLVTSVVGVEDPKFKSCEEAIVKELTFAANDKEKLTTVRYQVTFKPD